MPPDPPIFTKAPRETLDYTIDWSYCQDSAEGNAIVSSTWYVPTDLTSELEDHTDTTTTIWLSGGAEGSSYTLTNRTTRSNGQTKEQAITISVREK